MAKRSTGGKVSKVSAVVLTGLGLGLLLNASDDDDSPSVARKILASHESTLDPALPPEHDAPTPADVPRRDD